MEAFSRLIVLFLIVLLAVQLTTGGWQRLRAWLHVKFIGTAA